MTKYAKAIIAIIGATLTAVSVALEDDRILGEEWVAIAVALVTAVGVFWVPNKTGYDAAGGGHT
jgi:hypothetical protein